MRKTAAPLAEKAFSTSGASFQNFQKSSENLEFKWCGEPFLPVDRVFRYRRGDLAARRISGERFLMPDTTPMAMYSVTTEEPP